jgi:hypothetical protein
MSDSNKRLQDNSLVRYPWATTSPIICLLFRKFANCVCIECTCTYSIKWLVYN